MVKWNRSRGTATSPEFCWGTMSCPSRARGDALLWPQTLPVLAGICVNPALCSHSSVQIHMVTCNNHLLILLTPGRIPWDSTVHRNYPQPKEGSTESIRKPGTNTNTAVSRTPSAQGARLGHKCQPRSSWRCRPGVLRKLLGDSTVPCEQSSVHLLKYFTHLPLLSYLTY